MGKRKNCAAQDRNFLVGLICCWSAVYLSVHLSNALGQNETIISQYITTKLPNCKCYCVMCAWNMQIVNYIWQ